MNGISVFAGGKAGRSQHFTGLAREVGVLRQSPLPWRDFPGLRQTDVRPASATKTPPALVATGGEVTHWSPLG